MALKPIYGYSGNFPVLDFIGNPSVDPVMPVCMESPCQHPMWSLKPIEGYYDYGGVMTSNPGEIIVTKTEIGFPHDDGIYPVYASCARDVYMHYTGFSTVNLTIQCSSGAITSEASIYVVNPQGASPTTIEAVHLSDPAYSVVGPQSGSFIAPYYRYRIRVLLGVNVPAPPPDYISPAGDWVKLSIGFS